MAEITRVLPSKLLERIWLCVNFDCNLSCSYCVSDSSPQMQRPSLDEHTFRAVLDEATRVGFRQVAITGGEPFLHPDILPMLAYASSRIKTVVLTNATLLQSRRLGTLKELKRDSLTLQVSLDSAAPELHDLRRGPGSWKRTVQGLELLLEWGFNVAVRTTLTDQSDRHTGDLRLFLRERGISEQQHYAMPVVKGGRAKHGLDVSFGDLAPEPTLTADGLYWHPLKVDRSLAIAEDVLPLSPSLERFLDAAEQVRPSQITSAYR